MIQHPAECLRIGGAERAKIDATSGGFVVKQQPIVGPPGQPKRNLFPNILSLAFPCQAAQHATQKSVGSRRDHIHDLAGSGVGYHHGTVAAIREAQFAARHRLTCRPFTGALLREPTHRGRHKTKSDEGCRPNERSRGNCATVDLVCTAASLIPLPAPAVAGRAKSFLGDRQ